MNPEVGGPIGAEGVVAGIYVYSVVFLQQW